MIKLCEMPGHLGKELSLFAVRMTPGGRAVPTTDRSMALGWDSLVRLIVSALQLKTPAWFAK